MELFIERARLVQPHFQVSASNALVIAQICFHLDGIPLAVELAAARMKMMTPEQINLHLDRISREIEGVQVVAGILE